MRTVSLLQSNAGSAHILQDWLVSEFAQGAGQQARELVVNVPVAAPEGLLLYGSGEANASQPCDVMIEASFDDAAALYAFMETLRRWAPVSVPVYHAYAVSVTTVVHRKSFALGRPTPGFKLLRGLFLYDDLSDAAAQRMWAHHSELAQRVHVGLTRYARHWVDERLTADAPRVRGFSDLHLPDEDSLRHRYFDSARGREEILHDIGHFISGGLERVFAKEYVF